MVPPSLMLVACLLSSLALAVTDDPQLGGRAGPLTYSAAALVAISAACSCLWLARP